VGVLVLDAQAAVVFRYDVREALPTYTVNVIKAVIPVVGRYVDIRRIDGRGRGPGCPPGPAPDGAECINLMEVSAGHEGVSVPLRGVALWARTCWTRRRVVLATHPRGVDH
jgi:hypothetical protein